MQQRQSNDRGVWDVRRKIVVPALTGDSTPASAIETVEALEGVRSVGVEAKEKQLIVSYDASRIDYHTIVTILSQAGFPPLNSWWSNLRAKIYQFTDTNARENANTPASPCCNKPPK